MIARPHCGRLLAAALVLAAAMACGDRSGGAAPATGPAGEVVAAAGEVRAERGDPPESRALAVGDPVHAEDVVITAAEASVRIVLAHNQAIWSLEGGERRQVRESAAWTAPKQQGGGMLAGDQDDRTTAAGRHAEREAAETAATADESAAAPAAAMPDPEPVVSREPEPSRRQERSDEPRVGGAPERQKTTEKKKRTKRRKRTSDHAGEELEQTIVGQEAPAASPVPDADPPAGKLARVRLELGEVTGGLVSDEVRTSLTQQIQDVRGCYQQALAEAPELATVLTVVFSIRSEGTVSSARITSGHDALPSRAIKCLHVAWHRLRLPAPPDGSAQATVRYNLESGER